MSTKVRQATSSDSLQSGATLSDLNNNPLFQASTTCLWVEDLTRVYLELIKYHLDGVEDLAKHFENFPHLTTELMGYVKVLAVNPATIQLFEATDRQKFIANRGSCFGDGNVAVFEDTLHAMWSGRDEFRGRVDFTKETGEAFTATISYKIPKTLQQASRVLVSIDNIRPYINDELRLDIIMKALPHGCILINHEGQIIERLSEYRVFTDYINDFSQSNKLSDFLPDQISDEIIKNIDVCSRSGKSRVFEISLSNSDKPSYFEITLSQIPDRLEFVMLISDITDRKETEKQLLNSHKTQSIWTLAGGVAHELNNVLSPIMGYSELLLKRGSLEPSVNRSVTQIHNASKRAAHLIEQLLKYSGKSVKSFEQANLSSVVYEVIASKALILPDNIEIDVNTRVSDAIVTVVKSDVQEALFNIITNAIEAMPKGGLITICVSETHRMDELENVNHSYYQISVCDVGKGIDKEYQSQVFDPFFSTKSFGQALGLGLSVVFGVMKLHGGFAEIDPNYTKGTKINLLFPTDL